MPVPWANVPADAHADDVLHFLSPISLNLIAVASLPPSMAAWHDTHKDDAVAVRYTIKDREWLYLWRPSKIYTRNASNHIMTKIRESHTLPCTVQRRTR